MNLRILPAPYIYGLIWGNSYLDQNYMKHDETWYTHLVICCQAGRTPEVSGRVALKGGRNFIFYEYMSFSTWLCFTQVSMLCWSVLLTLL